MSVEILHFRKAEDILKKKGLLKDVQATMEYLDEVLYGTLHKRELMKQALEEMGWREEKMSILDGRRYQYKGFKKGVAIEGSFSAYEAILEGLIRLQIGHDKKKIESGILLLTSQRSNKTPYGSTRKMLEEDIPSLYPTISLPLTVALFDLGRPEVEETEEEKTGEEKEEQGEQEARDNQEKEESQKIRNARYRRKNRNRSNINNNSFKEQ